MFGCAFVFVVQWWTLTRSASIRVDKISARSSTAPRREVKLSKFQNVATVPVDLCRCDRLGVDGSSVGKDACCHARRVLFCERGSFLWLCIGGDSRA